MDAHFVVAKEALFQRLMPIYGEVQLGAIEAFSSKPSLSVVAAAIAGAMLAYVVLYVLGVRMRALPEKHSSEEQKIRIAALEKKAHFWLPYLLILAPTPLGTVVLLAAGFFCIRWWLVLGVTLAAECAMRYPLLA